MNGNSVRLSAYYGPSWVNFNKLLRNLKKIAEKFDKDDCIIAGDFNLNLPTATPDNHAYSFTNRLTSYNLKCSNDVRIAT